jgi:hypothetical protein
MNYCEHRDPARPLADFNEKSDEVVANEKLPQVSSLKAHSEQALFRSH